MTTRGAEYVLKQASEAGVGFIGLWFTDAAGRHKTVDITGAQLEAALTDGVAFDGGSMVGAARTEERDFRLLPDPETFAVLPWRQDLRVGRMFCDLVNDRGQPSHHDGRSLLKQTLDAAAREGRRFYAAAELEGYYFRGAALPPTRVDGGSYFDALPADDLIQVRRETVVALEELGIAVEQTHHEVGPGQYEIKLGHADPLALADALVTTRYAAKLFARRRGLLASFMPKPLEGQPGSGLHMTLSMRRQQTTAGGAPAVVDAFADDHDPSGLNATGQAFLAGLLEHAQALTLVTNPTVNSYKRLGHGGEAPSRCTWTRSNWADLVRVPSARAEHGGLGTIEYRAPDPSCNPYLALTALLAAGLDGVARGLQAPPMRAPGTDAVAVRSLPTTLAEAADLAATSPFVEQAVGAPLRDTLVEVARREWRAYHAQVSPWELARYFEAL